MTINGKAALALKVLLRNEVPPDDVSRSPVVDNDCDGVRIELAACFRTSLCSLPLNTHWQVNSRAVNMAN